MIATLLALSLGAGPQSPTPLHFLDMLQRQQQQTATVQQLWQGHFAQQLAVGTSPCEQVALIQASANLYDIQEDYTICLAQAANTSDPKEAIEILDEAWDEMIEALELTKVVFDLRVRVCGKIGGEAYEPEIDPANFTSNISNPYLPYKVGATWTYEGESEDGLEVIHIEVLNETRELLGVECRAVRDTVTIDGELLEDTVDYYAQDMDGTVWYFGEISINYEDGHIADIDGTWFSGIDGAQPGIVMPAEPHAGQAFRQEYLLSEAEDVAEIRSTTDSLTFAFGSFSDLIRTRDIVPLEPDSIEDKYYAKGIGFIFERGVETGETVELVGHSIP